MSDDTIHAFEKAGLGQAPFAFVGIERRLYKAAPEAPTQPGGACDYCGRPIVECCIIESADGKLFIVGNVCVSKTNDKGLQDPMPKALRKVRREAKRERDLARIAAAEAALPKVKDALNAQPHPYAGMARDGHTLLGFVLYMFENAGVSGKIKAARAIEKALAKLATKES